MTAVKTVQLDPQDDARRFVLFAREVTEFPPEAKKLVADLGEKEEEVLTTFEVTFGYDQMSTGPLLSLHLVLILTDEVLKKILPSGLELVTGFEGIGHIAHMNLRDECLPYKYIIGRVILDVRQCS